MYQHLHHGGDEGEEREQEIKNLFEKMIQNFPNLVKETDIQVQEAWRAQPTQTQRDPYQDTSRSKCQRLKTESQKQQEKSS